jgi:hypothetical protein
MSNGGELAGFQIVHPGPIKGHDDIRVASGNHMQIHNILSVGAGRDCFHAEPGFSSGWIESLYVENVTCWHAGRDNFNFTVSDGHGISRLEVQTEGGLALTGQTPHTGTNTTTLNNFPCAPGNPQDWLAVQQINDATYYIPACRP